MSSRNLLNLISVFSRIPQFHKNYPNYLFMPHYSLVMLLKGFPLPHRPSLCVFQKPYYYYFINMFASEKNQRISKQSRLNEENSVLAGFSKKRPSISPLRQQFFGLKSANGARIGSEQSLSKGSKNKNSLRVPATDESSNNHPSIFQDSIELIQKRQLNEEYFQPLPNPLCFKQKRTKMGLKKSQEAKRMEDVSIRLNQISQMVVSQEKQIRKLKSTVSEKELHRLLKMHSIEKMQLLSQISQKKKGKAAG